MSTRKRKMAFNEKAKKFWEQHKPIGKKSTLLDSTYKIKPYGPYDSNYDGIPNMGRYKAFGTLVIVYLSFYYWIANNYPVEMFGIAFDTGVFAIMTTWATIIGLGTAFVCMWLYITLSRGTFDKYKRIVNAFVRFLDGRPMIPTEWRVLGEHTLWTPDMRGLNDE